MVTAPLQRSTDTTVTYTVLITDSLGCVFDTSITVQLLASSSSEVSDTVNQNDLPVTYNGQTVEYDGDHAGYSGFQIKQPAS